MESSVGSEWNFHEGPSDTPWNFSGGLCDPGISVSNFYSISGKTTTRVLGLVLINMRSLPSLG